MIHGFRSGAAICSLVVGGGLLASMLSVSAQASGSGAQIQHSGPAFCRQAPSLPSLPPERSARQQGQADDREAAYPPPPPALAVPSAASSPVSKPALESGDAAMMASPAAPMGASRGKAGDEASRVSAMPVPPHRRIPPRPPREVQSGLLTAGEHDDILNSKLYAAYVRDSQLGQSIPDLPLVDTRRMLRVEVRDRAGKAIPAADIVVRCSDGNTISLKTLQNGTATFFTAIDRLSPTITIEARKNGRSLAAPQNVRVENQDGGQHLVLKAAGAAHQPAKALDLMLVIDTTGSMGDEIRYLQAELTSIVKDLKARHRQLDVRVGFVFYRDNGDAYVTQTVDFSGDIAKASHILGQQSASGGGDYPEAMDQALIRAVGASWRDDSVKSLVLVADAPPHDDQFGRTWAVAETARAKQIQITPVAASGVGDKAEYVMRAMAAATQSRYLFLTDDSGIGNPHAPPAVACYVVTRLDALLRRVVDSQLSGERIEPDQGEIIRTVGQYDKGKCALPNDFRWQ